MAVGVQEALEEWRIVFNMHRSSGRMCSRSGVGMEWKCSISAGGVEGYVH